MFKAILACAIAVSTVVSLSADGFAAPAIPSAADHNKMCQAVFAKNEMAIEKMVGAGDLPGIQALLAKGNCSEFAEKLLKIHCEPTLDPIGINCTITFGRR